jgi:hypothetical protein
MPSFDGELNRWRRSYEADPENSDAKERLCTLLTRQGKELEAQRIQTGYWHSDRIEEHWEARISRWGKIDEIAGIQQSGHNIACFSDSNNYLAWVGYNANGRPNPAYYVADLASFRVLISKKADMRFVFCNLYSFEDSFLLIGPSENLSFTAGTDTHWNHCDFHGRTYFCRQKNTLIFARAKPMKDSNQIVGWPTQVHFSIPSNLTIVAINWPHYYLALEGGQTLIKSFDHQILQSIPGVRHWTTDKSSGDFFMNDQLHKIRENGDYEVHPIDFHGYQYGNQIIAAQLSPCRRSLRALYGHVPRSLDLMTNQLSTLKDGIGIECAQPTDHSSSFWHPFANIAAVLRSPDFSNLELRNTNGHAVLSLGKRVFLCFSRDGTRMAVARPTPSGSRIEIWG